MSLLRFEVIIAVLALSCLAAASARHHHHHKKSKTPSFEAQSCWVKPDGNSLVLPGSAFVLTCHFDREPEVCTWRHDKPGKEANSSGKSDVLCKETRDGKGKKKQKNKSVCHGHSRMTFENQMSPLRAHESFYRRRLSSSPHSKKHRGGKRPNVSGGWSGRNMAKTRSSSSNIKRSSSPKSCSIRVAGSTPEDAGEWTLDALAPISRHKMAHTSHTFRVRTANASSLRIEDGKGTVLSGEGEEADAEVSFSRGDWVELKAVAEGGRPAPKITWKGTDGDTDLEAEKFKIIQQSGRCSDRQGLICEEVSTILFLADEDEGEDLADEGTDDETEEGDQDSDFEVIEAEEDPTTFEQLKDKVREVIEEEDDEAEEMEEMAEEAGEEQRDIKMREKRFARENMISSFRLTVTVEQEGLGKTGEKTVLINILDK